MIEQDIQNLVSAVPPHMGINTKSYVRTRAGGTHLNFRPWEAEAEGQKLKVSLGYVAS